MTSEPMDVVVIGAGLFGSIIAKSLRASGQRVAVIADQRPGMGSLPAACLMKPSWLAAVDRVAREQSLETLDQLYGVRDLEFELKSLDWLPKGRATVHWCDPNKILQPPDIFGTVARISSDGTHRRTWLADPERPGTPRASVRSRHVVMATGMWGKALAPELFPDVSGRWGAAFLWKTGYTTPFIRPWAPYKQIVGFDRGDGFWVGDGTSVKELTGERCLTSKVRCAEAVGAEPSDLVELAGARPYTRLTGGAPCYLASSDNLHVATGGAKNGTLAAGWAAHQLTERLS